MAENIKVTGCQCEICDSYARWTPEEYQAHLNSCRQMNDALKGRQTRLGKNTSLDLIKLMSASIA